MFRKTGSEQSATFHYWASFLEAGYTLIKLLSADHEANFEMEKDTDMDTVPYFFLAGCVNYARYAPVYLAEMKNLEVSSPEMFRHMLKGGFVVRRSKEDRTFNYVPTNQALEQSINRWCHRVHIAEKGLDTVASHVPYYW